MEGKDKPGFLPPPSSLHPPPFPVAVFFLLHFPCPWPTVPRHGRFRTVGVTHHRVLWSPDFPLPGSQETLPGQRPSSQPVDSSIVSALPLSGRAGRVNALS